MEAAINALIADITQESSRTTYEVFNLSWTLSQIRLDDRGLLKGST